MILIDAYNLIIRNYVKSSLLNDEGENIGAVTGTITSLYYLLKKFPSRQVYLCFEGKNSGQRRRKSFHDYKDGRKAPHTIKSYNSDLNLNTNFWWCLNRIVELLDFLPICSLSLDNLEADDIISFLCKRFNDEKILIVSNDKDYFQLVDNNVSIYRPVKDELINYENFLLNFELLPKNWLILKSLSGDSSDNIQKIPLRIGLKTLLKRYPELKEKVYDIDMFIDLVKSKDDKKMFEYFDILKSNYELMNLVENNQFSYLNENILKNKIINFDPQFDSINFDMMSHKYGVSYKFSQMDFSFLFKKLKNEFTSEKSNIREVWK